MCTPRHTSRLRVTALRSCVSPITCDKATNVGQLLDRPLPCQGVPAFLISLPPPSTPTPPLPTFQPHNPVPPRPDRAHACRLDRKVLLPGSFCPSFRSSLLHDSVHKQVWQSVILVYIHFCFQFYYWLPVLTQQRFPFLFTNL